jgi:hypothetical protein
MTDALKELVPFLRKHGVVYFQSADVTLRFEPKAPSEAKAQAMDLNALEPQAEADKCKCGHASYMHTNGLCTVGCDLNACVPDEVVQ